MKKRKQLLKKVILISFWQFQLILIGSICYGQNISLNKVTSALGRKKGKENISKQENTRNSDRSSVSAIVFSGQKFNNETGNSKNDFTEGEYIYGRINLDKPIKEYAVDNILTFDVTYRYPGDDNGVVSYVKIDVSGCNQENTQVDFDVLANPSEATTLYADYALAPSVIEMVMTYAKDGSSVEFRWSLEQLSGNFNFHLKKQSTFKAWIEPIRKKAFNITQDQDALNTPLPEEFGQQSYSFKDPQLSKEKIISYLPSDIKVLKMVIGPGEDYKVMKNELGVILYKQTARYIMVAYKDLNNGFCYYDNCIFERPYEGNGKYGTLKLRTNGGRIDCNNIK